MSERGVDWFPVTDPHLDAPDGATVTDWPSFGPGTWERRGDRWERVSGVDSGALP